jgi:hypothetical protein
MSVLVRRVACNDKRYRSTRDANSKLELPEDEGSISAGSHAGADLSISSLWRR